MMNVFGFHSLYTAYIILQLVVHRRTSQGFTLLDKSHSYMAFDTWDASTSSKLKFKFKTACSYCLLLYLDGNRFKSNGTNYIELTMEQKQLKMKAQFIAPFIESVTLGNELNDLEWHSVEISRTLNDFHITVDDYKGSITVGNIEVKLSSYLFVGGVKRSYLKNAARKEGLLYIPRFVGCIEDLELSRNSGPFKAPIVMYSEKVQSGCVDACKTTSCANGGRCLNWFNKVGCDCIGTGYEGNDCSTPSESMHFNSTEYIVWKVGRNAEKIRKINVRFKTKYPNGIIMFSDSPSSTLFIELINGHLRIIKDKFETYLGNGILHDTRWHLLSIYIRREYISVILDKRIQRNSTILSTGSSHGSSDTKIYIGGQKNPRLLKKSRSVTNFIGCLQQLFIDEINVVFKVLHTHSPYMGIKGDILPLCTVDTENITLTVPPTTVSTTTITTTKMNKKEETPLKRIATRKRPTQKAKRSSIKNPKKEVNIRDQSSYQQSNRQRRATGDRDKIAWITSGIVSGTIVLMIATACIIHYFKYKYGGVLISKVNEREYGEPQPRPEADGQIDEGSYVSTLNHRNGNSTLNSNGTLNGNGTLSGNGTLNGHKNANGMDSDHLNGRANGHSPTEITELFSKQQTAIYIPQRHSHKATKV